MLLITLLLIKSIRHCIRTSVVIKPRRRAFDCNAKTDIEYQNIKEVNSKMHCLGFSKIDRKNIKLNLNSAYSTTTYLLLLFKFKIK